MLSVTVECRRSSCFYELPTPASDPKTIKQQTTWPSVQEAH